jgi:hypothetical protein
MTAAIQGPRPLDGDQESRFLESHPLFMTSLPDEINDDVTLSALQSLTHEGTPDGGLSAYDFGYQFEEM